MGVLAGACDKSLPVATRTGPLAPAAFWVWHRRSPLTKVEQETWRQAGGGTLYWQVAECEWRDGRWHSVEIADRVGESPGGLVVPVFRLKPVFGFLGAREVAAKALAAQIRDWWGTRGALAEIQLDFDCPDRLLGEYADFLVDCGRQLAPTRISITALAAWPRHPQFAKLARSVCALAPMFYDLAADAPEAVRAGRFQPLAAPAAVALIESWRNCPVRWLAGLPNFERVSVFGADGELVGHLRGWTHDPLVFHRSLVGRPAGPGVTDYAVTAPLVLADTQILLGQRVVWRTVEDGVLATLTAAADRAGACGIVYFALPGPGVQAAFSPRHLAFGRGAVPQLELAATAQGTVVLKNSGPTDLAARAGDPAMPGERGWQLELRSLRRGSLRAATPGGFVAAKVAERMAVDDATGLVLYFSQLPSGGAITSGACIEKSAAVTWRVVGVTDPRPLDGADNLPLQHSSP